MKNLFIKIIINFCFIFFASIYGLSIEPLKELEKKAAAGDKAAQDQLAELNSHTTKLYEGGFEIQKIEPAELIITDEDELKGLAKQYAKGFPVHGIPGLDRLRLTYKSLKHVFGTQTGKDRSKGVYLSGFHHDEMLNKKRKMFYFSLRTAEHGIQEGFMALDKTHVPVFKTFFSALLSKQQVVDLLVSSLEDPKKRVESQDNKTLLIEGKTSQGIHIRTIVNKNTGEVITFFPITEKPEEEIQAEAKKLQDLFEKLFWHRSEAPMRLPITEKEITELLQLYSAIPFNMVAVKVDMVRPEDRKQMARYGHIVHPYFLSKFIRESDFETFLNKYPGLIFLQETTPKTLHFTREALAHVFSEKNDANFPSYLTRKQIMDLVIEALKNFERIAPKPGTKNALGQLAEVDDRKDNVLSILSGTNGTGKNDAFTFYIKIDESTGNIKDFYPLAH